MNKELQNIFLELMARYSDNELFNLECWQEIEKQHSKKSRYYHNLLHLSAMVCHMELVKDKIEAPDVMLFTIFYHDIIYRSSRKDNEHKSALFFKKRIKKTNFSRINEVILQIEATKSHEASISKDTNILLDIDMSILGEEKDTYRKYSEAVRKEYKMFPNFIYYPARAKVLRHFLATSIFKTPYFKVRYERMARENIANELNSMQS